MTQYAFDLAPTNSGDDLVAALDSWRDAIQSSHKGAVQPTYRVAGMFWLDDAGGATSTILKQYDGTDWITVCTFNYTANTVVFAGAIANSLLTTRGDLIRRNATIPERVALGTVGKVLMSDGTDPGWEEPDLKVLLASGSLSGATVDIVLTSYIALGYTRFKLVYRGWQGVTDAQLLWLRVSVNGGSSFLATGYGGSVAYGIAASVASAAHGTTGFECCLATGNLSNEVSSGEINIERGSVLATFYGIGHSITATPAHATFVTSGYTVQGNIDALRLLPSSGNHAAGTYILYGIKEN